MISNAPLARHLYHTMPIRVLRAADGLLPLVDDIYFTPTIILKGQS